MERGREAKEPTGLPRKSAKQFFVGKSSMENVIICREFTRHKMHKVPRWSTLHTRLTPNDCTPDSMAHVFDGD